MLMTQIFVNGKFKMINEETDFFIGRSGSGTTVFGEHAKLFKILKSALVFKTESGALVKTKIDYLQTIGKAAKNGYWVSLRKRNEGEYIKTATLYWNDKKCCMENK